jgi:hypothetical protein
VALICPPARCSKTAKKAQATIPNLARINALSSPLTLKKARFAKEVPDQYRFLFVSFMDKGSEEYCRFYSV